MGDVNLQSNELSPLGGGAPSGAPVGSMGHNKGGVAAAVRSTGMAAPLAGSTHCSGGCGPRPSAGGGVFVRRFVREWDYPVWAGWLVAWGREVVPEWALPDVGFVVCGGADSLSFGGGLNDEAAGVACKESGSKALAMCFGYREGRCGLVTWLTGRPGLSPRRALTACALVWGAVERELVECGAGLLISPTARPSLVKFMRRRGWRVAHEANVLLWRNVDEAGGVR